MSIRIPHARKICVDDNITIPTVQTLSKDRIYTYTHTHTTEMTTFPRPLYQMLIEPTASMLNVFLKETNKLDAQVNVNRSHVGGCYPEIIRTATRRCIDSSINIYKVAVLLLWIVLDPSIRGYFAKGENPRKFQIWFGVLQAGYDNYIMGLKPDGSKYKDDDYLALANTPYFVHRMIEFYSDM